MLLVVVLVEKHMTYVPCATGPACLIAGLSVATVIYAEKGLKLPGSGTKRDRAKPRELTQGETRTLLYNIACCQAELEDFPKVCSLLTWLTREPVEPPVKADLFMVQLILLSSMKLALFKQ